MAFALALLASVCASLAATVYVDRNGNDGNPGTAKLPLRSLEALSRRIWRPGDAIYFRGGQTFTGVLMLPGGGSDSKPVILGSYDNGKATIDSAGRTLFFGYNQGGFQFQDLNLKSSASCGMAAGILCYTDSPMGTRYPAITVKNCDLRGFGGPAIKIGSWQPSNPGWTTISVENCQVIGNGEGMAIYGYDESAAGTYASSYLQVTNSEFACNRGTGLSICGVSGGLVEFCSFHDNRRVGGCWTWAARNVLIRHCISYKNRRGGGNDGFGFDLDGGSVGCTIEYCLSYLNDTAGFAIFDYPNSAETVNNTIRYCISENDVRSDREGGSFVMNSWANTPIRNSNVSNCVAFLASRGGNSTCAGFMGIGRQTMEGYQSGGISGCSFCNNIIFLAGDGSDLAHLNCQFGANTPSEIVFQGNNYASSKHRPLRILTDPVLYTSLAEWRTNTGQERLNGSSENENVGISDVSQFAPLGEFHRITNPALLALSTVWHSIPNSSCLGAGLDANKQFRLNQEHPAFAENPISQNGSVTPQAVDPQTAVK